MSKPIAEKINPEQTIKLPCERMKKGLFLISIVSAINYLQSGVPRPYRHLAISSSVMTALYSHFGLPDCVAKPIDAEELPSSPSRVPRPS